MKILQRYVLDEIWIPFLISLTVLNFIFLGGYLAQASNFIIGRGVSFFDTLYILLLALPEMASYTVPTSILTAVLIVVGTFSQNNEIRAMRASGMNPLVMMKPAFLLGLVLSAAMFVFNDLVVTNAGFQLRKETKKLLIKNPMALIEPGRSVKISDTVVFHAKQVVGSELRDIVAFENEGEDKDPIRTIIAERGEIVSTDGGNEVQIRLFDGSISDADQKSIQSIQFKTYEFPTMGQEDIRQMRKKTREFSVAELMVRLGVSDLSQSDGRDAWSMFHQRIAFSLGCFLFVGIGIPIGILVKRGEIIWSFSIAMAVASLYYILFAGAKSLAYQGFVPPVIAFWLPNLLLGWAGYYLFQKSQNT